MDCDDVAVLDAEVVANHTVHASAAIIQIIVVDYDQDCVFSLFALYQDCVASEELERLHGVVR